MQKYSAIIGLFILLIITSCVVRNRYSSIAPGKWRGILKIDNRELPFNFEVDYNDKDEPYITIRNASEKIRIDDVTVEDTYGFGDAKDITIDFPHYDSYIKARYKERIMEGDWYVKSRGDYSIPFQAEYGRDYRFTNLKKAPVMDITGRWETTFGLDKRQEFLDETELEIKRLKDSLNKEVDKSDFQARIDALEESKLTADKFLETAIGEFVQHSGNQLKGTFITETGDYRFLEGTIQNNKMYLSCFDGSHAFLFEAKILADKTMIGAFWSGSHYKTTWTAVKNPNIKLRNADSLTYLKEGYEKIEFSFPNVDGKQVSLNDPLYKGKVKIVQILGTWCPNCADETTFLVDYLAENKSTELEVVGLAYEKYKEFEEAIPPVKRFINRFEVPYPVLVAGYANKKEAAKTLPMLNHVYSYPTMIFIDKNDKVRKIHTGFSGPATSDYESFVTEFDRFVKQLLAE